jgi:hypothetical protein
MNYNHQVYKNSKSDKVHYQEIIINLTSKMRMWFPQRQ